MKTTNPADIQSVVFDFGLCCVPISKGKFEEKRIYH